MSHLRLFQPDGQPEGQQPPESTPVGQAAIARPDFTTVAGGGRWITRPEAERIAAEADREVADLFVARRAHILDVPQPERERIKAWAAKRGGIPPTFVDLFQRKA